MFRTYCVTCSMLTLSVLTEEKNHTWTFHHGGISIDKLGFPMKEFVPMHWTRCFIVFYPEEKDKEGTNSRIFEPMYNV